MSKKKLFALCGVVVYLFVLAGCTGDRLHTNFSGSNNNQQSNLTASGWNYSASSVNGNVTARNITFTSDNLSSFHVESSLGSGNATLILIQGDNEREIDISNGFSDYIDTSGFEAGERDSIRIRIRFENASNVNINMKW